LKVYDELLLYVGVPTESVLREGIAKTLCNKGCLLAELKREDEAIGIFDEVISRFDNDAESAAMREVVAATLLNKGAALAALGRLEEEIAVYNEIIGRFGKASEPLLQAVVEGARRAKAAKSNPAAAESSA
jgi:tetratricopeptide (TPR) repeat protein